VCKAWYEHGGFFDHVRPGPAVPPVDLETATYVRHGFKLDQLGVRVPALVISPYTQRGVIDHTTYDHTSMLATLERLFGMGNLTDRDEEANDFLHLLPLTSPRTDAPATLPPVAVDPNPLSCDDEGDDVDAVDTLLLRRSELRIARARGRHGHQAAGPGWRAEESTAASATEGERRMISRARARRGFGRWLEW
jgi:phospholipase C